MKGPITVARKLHKGLVAIPFPNLPMPRRRREITAPAVVQVKELAISVPQPVVKSRISGPPVIEDVAYETPAHVSEDEKPVKDMKDYIVESIDYGDYGD